MTRASIMPINPADSQSPQKYTAASNESGTEIESSASTPLPSNQLYSSPEEVQAMLTAIDEGQSSADDRIANAYISRQPQRPISPDSEADVLADTGASGSDERRRRHCCDRHRVHHPKKGRQSNQQTVINLIIISRTKAVSRMLIRIW